MTMAQHITVPIAPPAPASISPEPDRRSDPRIGTGWGPGSPGAPRPPRRPMHRIARFGIILLLVLAGCSGIAAPDPATPTPDPLAGLVGKEWKTTLIGFKIPFVPIPGKIEMTMTFYRGGDVRAELPLLARYTGTYRLADAGLLRFDWEEELIGMEERRSFTEFWRFHLSADELVLINDESGETRVFTAQ